MQTSADCPPEHQAAVTKCGHCKEPVGDDGAYRIQRTAKTGGTLEIDWVLFCEKCLAEHDAKG